MCSRRSRRGISASPTRGQCFRATTSARRGFPGCSWNHGRPEGGHYNTHTVGGDVDSGLVGRLPMVLSDLPTPQVLVDRARAQRNIERVQALAARARAKLRPHAKTHKSPIVARWQIDSGAVGVCCAKVGEAEVFADAGITDIRLPYPVNPSNATRLLPVMDRAAVSIIVDHLDVARGWSETMQRAGRTLDVLVKVDVGIHRCGIDPAGKPIEFLQAVSAMPGLRLRGLLSPAR